MPARFLSTNWVRESEGGEAVLLNVNCGSCSARTVLGERKVQATMLNVDHGQHGMDKYVRLEKKFGGQFQFLVLTNQYLLEYKHCPWAVRRRAVSPAVVEHRELHNFPAKRQNALASFRGPPLIVTQLFLFEGSVGTWGCDWCAVTTFLARTRHQLVTTGCLTEHCHWP